MPPSMRSKPQFPLYAIGLPLLCLLLFLTGCATNPQPQEARGNQKQYPPESLLLEAPVAEWPASTTNWGLLEIARTYRRQLQECQADKAAIRAWATQ